MICAQISPALWTWLLGWPLPLHRVILGQGLAVG
jgi:hypothetical protein